MTRNNGDQRVEERRISLRWGIPWLDGGHTVIMNLFLKHYQQVGITNTEMTFIIHLASFAFESKNGECRPSVTTTIRQRMGYQSDKGVLQVLHSLEDKGMVKITRRPGKPSLYDLSPFAKAIEEAALKAQEGAEETPDQEVSPDQKVRTSPDQKVTQRRTYKKKRSSPSEYRGGDPSPEPLNDPSEEREGEEPGRPNGSLKKGMAMLRERCEARGYSPERSVASRDAKDLKAMLEGGYSLANIFLCYDSKSAEPRFADRHLPMAFVREDLGAWLASRGGDGKRPPGKRRGGNGDRGRSGLPSTCPKCFEEGEPLPGQREQALTDGVRCSYVGCLHHQFRMTGKTALPGRCTRWPEPREAEMVAEAGATKTP